MFNEGKDMQWFSRAKHSWSKVNQALATYMLSMYALYMFVPNILATHLRRKTRNKDEQIITVSGFSILFILKLAYMSL